MPDTQVDQDAVSKFLANYTAFQPPPPPPSLLAQGLAGTPAPAPAGNPLALSIPPAENSTPAPAPEAPAAPRITAPGDIAPAIKIPKLDTSGEPYQTVGQTPEDLAAKAASSKAASVESSKPGLDTLWSREANIQNPFLRALARAGTVGLHVLNAAGSAIAPEVMAQIPGTPWHHTIAVEQAEREATDAQQRATGATANIAAQIAANNASLAPQEAEDKNANALQKIQDAANKADADRKEKYAKITADAIAKGNKIVVGPDGKPVIDEATGLPKTEFDPASKQGRQMAAKALVDQATVALKASEARLDDLKTKIQGDPNSLQNQAIVARIKAEQDRTEFMRENLRLATDRLGFAEDSHYNPQPTGGERRAGDWATSVLHSIGNMRDVIARRPDLFGTGAGRITAMKNAIGNDDPDIAMYRAAAATVAEHQAAMFGARGEYVMKDLQDLTNPRFDPANLNSTLHQAEESAQIFKDRGTVHGAPSGGFTITPTSSTGGTAQTSGNTQSGGKTRVQLRGGTVVSVTPDKLAAVLAAGGKVVQ